MKVAAIQMPTVKDKIQNIRTAGTYIEKIKAENPDFVILPEMFCCPYQTNPDTQDRISRKQEPETAF